MDVENNEAIVDLDEIKEMQAMPQFQASSLRALHLAMILLF